VTGHMVTVDPMGPVEVQVAELGTGRPVLLLHGGAGPMSVAGFAQLFASHHPVRVLTPTHPGFGGTPRPDALNSVSRLAQVYARLLDELDLQDVTVVGNSIGGWIASELALVDRHRLGRLVLVDAAGITVEGHPVADVFHLTMDEVAKRSYHTPAAFPINLAAMSDQQKAGMAANRATLAVYSGPSMGDDTLRGRLHGIDLPTLALWGASDRIVDPDYGRAWAAAIPGAEFELIPQAGHLPQIETPDALRTSLWGFMERTAARSAASRA
jgi:pimeloyl-ACP methyl ester carboxylesterase